MRKAGRLSMGKPVQRLWWRRCRLLFRACRIALLLLVLALIAIGAYLNEVGLPDFLKRPLLDELRARGLDLEFSRLRLSWYRGVVADDVRFGRADQDIRSPVLSLREVQVKLDHAALARFKLDVAALILRDGQLVWPVPDTNRSPRELVATNLQAQLRFLTNDQWQLDHFTANFAGTDLQLSGIVTNASALRDWKLFHPAPGAPSNAPGETLRRLADTLEKLKFSAPPELTIDFAGDARNVESFRGLLAVKAPGVETPWGRLTNGLFSARIQPPTTATNEPQADIELLADEAVLPVGQASNLFAHLHVMSGENLTNLIQARLEASADAFTTQWARSSGARLTAEWTHSMTNLIPISGSAEVHLTNAIMNRGSAGDLELDARLQPATDPNLPATDDTWAWWAGLAPYALDWNCRLQDIHAEDPRAGAFDLKEFNCGGLWRAPQLTITNAHAELYRGRFNGQATLDVATRAAAYSATADFDIQKIAPLLPPITRELLQQYSWDDPPLGHASGTAVLPPWTSGWTNWGEDFQMTVRLNGDVRTGSAAFRGVPVESAFLHYGYTNMVWTVPDLVAIRPEGRLELSTVNDDRAHRFYFHIRSTIDPRSLRHLVPEEGQKVFDSVIFTRPPDVEADIWGRWHKPEEIGVKAHVVVTNFALRGESATRFESDIQYTNGYFVLSDGRLESGEHYMTAGGLGVDLAARKAYLTNGFSTFEPAPFFRVIGKKVAQIMEPYQFSQPPSVHAYGTIPLAEEVDPDLHFQVDGGPFHWLRFNLDHISGGVDWVGKRLDLTNVDSEFYGGAMKASAKFDFAEDHPEADFSFNLRVTNADLHALMLDVASKTNHLEGRLTGQLNITRGNSADFNSWTGSGAADLRDGLLWDVPIFGVFSPVLDNLSPGLGESRADRGSATFGITNSVIYSDNLEIHAPALIMFYRGTVDFKTRVDAVVEAKLFRETPYVGWLLSTAFMPVTKLFQFKVAGTLEDPKMQPQFLLTKIPLMLFNPLQTLKDLAPSDNSPPASPPSTNAPPSLIPPVKDTP